MSDMYSAQADGDFSRARIKETLSSIQTFLNPDRTRLLSLNDVRTIVKPKGETYRGMQVVQIDRIVGSEGRYRDFNTAFLPKAEHMRPRWVKVDVAHYRDIILPPIQLYEIGGAYFVRDGNHRVSVAKLQGVESIDAEVISLDSEISLHSGMTLDELKHAVVAFEKKQFYEQTSFGTITGDENLDFSDPGQYDVIVNHVLVHKYYINQDSSTEIALEEAIGSWYLHVYSPIVSIIAVEHIGWRFPGRTQSDLYVFIVKHWHFLKKKYGLGYPLKEAVLDFTLKYGAGFRGWLRFLLGRKKT
ncbi:MAG: transcriptional regulator [Spirochaetes bacterium]|nr:transcriptional regulator [Spirochaetota bacterium]